jgi:serine/threonine protein phosphatase 1
MERAKVTAEDTLIFLGYVDGWSQSPQVLDYLIELNTTNSCVFIRGNHDELLLLVKDSKDNLMWYKHGGEATVLTGMKSRCYKTIAC